MDSDALRLNECHCPIHIAAGHVTDHETHGTDIGYPMPGVSVAICDERKPVPRGTQGEMLLRKASRTAISGKTRAECRKVPSRSLPWYRQGISDR